MEPAVHYLVHKGPPSDPILNQMNPVHIITPYLSKISFNIIVPSHLYHEFYWSTHLIVLDSVTLIVSGEGYHLRTQFSSMFSASVKARNVLISLFSNTLKLLASLRVSCQVLQQVAV
jgi:hypothetical protein